jgi:hypothetical protein
MKNKIIAGCWICSIIIAVLTTKIYFPNIKLKIVNSEIGPTQHQTNTANTDINNPADCQIAKDCANSDIKVVADTKGNKLYGRAYDDCKSADFMFEFEAQNTTRHIIQLGMGWNNKIGYFAHPGYLYQLDFAAIGCSFIIPKDKGSFGVEIVAQKAFK